MNKVIEDALRSTFQFIGHSIQFILGLAGALACSALLMSGEVLDELTTYKDSGPFPWLHVAKVMLPTMSGAAVAYIQHRRIVEKARHEDSPETISLRIENKHLLDISGIIPPQKENLR